MNGKILAAIAVALLVATAGCSAFGLGGTPTSEAGDPGASAADDGGGETPAAAGDDADRAGASSFDRPSVRAGDAFANYTELYDATIDSAVEIRVESDRGQGQGSGFVYHADGYVVTNRHVVTDTEEVSVGFASGEWRTGEVVGTDVYTDLAVIRVDSLPEAAEPLPLAERSPEPGQPVAAIGSPLGFQGSITRGIVSGTNRSMPVTGGFSIPDTVQTDAAINPGNSGGPLVATDGAVVGVNRATAGDNVGFAVSANVVDRVAPALIENGSFAHSYLGVRTVPVTPDVAEANDLASAEGMMVVDLPQGSPADGVLQSAERQAGPDGQVTYVGGDVIVGVAGQPVTSQHDLARHLLLETRPGEAIQVTVLRDGERVTETVTLGERPALTGQEGV